MDVSINTILFCAYIFPFLTSSIFWSQYLDTGPDFFQYWHFWGTIIDIRADENTYKTISHTSSDKEAVRSMSYIQKNIVNSCWYCNMQKIGLLCNNFPRSLYVKKARIFMCLKFFQYLTRINYTIVFRVQCFCQFFISNYFWFANFVSLIFLKRKTMKYAKELIDFNYVLYECVVIYIIRCEEMISVTRIFWNSQYFQSRTTVVYS